MTAAEAAARARARHGVEPVIALQWSPGANDKGRKLSRRQAQRLELQILTLLAEAEFDRSLWLPEQLLEARDSIDPTRASMPW